MFSGATITPTGERSDGCLSEEKVRLQGSKNPEELSATGPGRMRNEASGSSGRCRMVRQFNHPSTMLNTTELSTALHLLYVQPYITHQNIPLISTSGPLADNAKSLPRTCSAEHSLQPPANFPVDGACCSKTERINPSVGIGDPSAKLMVYSKKMHPNPSKTRRHAHQALIF